MNLGREKLFLDLMYNSDKITSYELKAKKIPTLCVCVPECTHVCVHNNHVHPDGSSN